MSDEQFKKTIEAFTAHLVSQGAEIHALRSLVLSLARTHHKPSLLKKAFSEYSASQLAMNAMPGQKTVPGQPLEVQFANLQSALSKLDTWPTVDDPDH